MVERRAELARVSHFKGDLWLINYKLWAACGCYYDRFVIQYTGEKPTDEQVNNIINEDKNKR